MALLARRWMHFFDTDVSLLNTRMGAFVVVWS